MADFIEQQRRLWYAVWDVPADCRHVFGGRKRLKKSLETDSRSEALKRVRPIVESWKAIAEKARGGGDLLAARAAYFRDALARVSDEDERQMIREQIADIADELDPRDPDAPDVDHRPDGTRFYGLATGALVEIRPLIEPWMTSRHVAEKTKDMDRATFALLKQHHRTVQEIDRRAATRFVENVLKRDRSPATVQRMLSGLNTFWKWLQNRGEFPENQRSPWEGQAPAKPRTKGTFATNKDGRRPFTEDEGAAFLDAVKAKSDKYPADAPVVEVMAVTGARLEEVCALTGADVEMGDGVAWIIVREGKTAAASRRIPIVAPAVIEGLRARVKAPAVPLFPELGVDRYGKRSQALSQRLGALLRHTVADPSVVAAHSWRHRGRTLVERADIEPATADWFFGHARDGEGLGRYSRGPSDEALMGTARAIPLPSPRDAAGVAARTPSLDVANKVEESPTARKSTLAGLLTV